MSADADMIVSVAESPEDDNTKHSSKDKSDRKQCVARIAPRVCDIGIPKQCSRKSKDGHSFCGTHLNNQPYGIVSENDMYHNLESVQVWCQDIHGIIYHLDAYNNVYHTYEIIQKVMNPRIIGRWIPRVTTTEENLDVIPLNQETNATGEEEKVIPIYSSTNQPINPEIQLF